MTNTTVIWKPYWHYQREEDWLNSMCARGLALKKYTWCRYEFEDCAPGEYTYRIELLERSPAHNASRKYLNFMEDSGVEVVSTYMSWVYFRKKTADGPFEIYSDSASRLAYYRRVAALWTTLAVLELVIGIMNLGFVAGELAHSGELLWTNFLGSLPVLLFGLFFLSIAASHRRQMRRIKKESSIFE